MGPSALFFALLTPVEIHQDGKKRMEKGRLGLPPVEKGAPD
jgi:hypothetical protein